MAKKWFVFMALMMALVSGCAAEAPAVSQARADSMQLQALTDAVVKLVNASRPPATTEGLPWMLLACAGSTFIILTCCVVLILALRNKPAEQPQAATTQIVRVERQVVFVVRMGRGEYLIRDDKGERTLDWHSAQDVALLEVLNASK